MHHFTSSFTSKAWQSKSSCFSLMASLRIHSDHQTDLRSVKYHMLSETLTNGRLVCWHIQLFFIQSIFVIAKRLNRKNSLAEVKYERQYVILPQRAMWKIKYIKKCHIINTPSPLNCTILQQLLQEHYHFAKLTKAVTEWTQVAYIHLFCWWWKVKVSST